MLFNERVKLLLEKKRMSQLRFAEILGVSSARLSNYLLGKVEANYTVLKSMAEFLGTTCDYLLGRKLSVFSQKGGLSQEFLPGWEITEDYGPEVCLGDFSVRLKGLLKERGLTQSALAASIGTVPAMLSNYISGRVEASFDTLVIIASLLDTTVDYLLGLSADSGERGYPAGVEARYAGLSGVTGETCVELPVFGTGTGRLSGGFVCLAPIKTIYGRPYILSVTDESMAPACRVGDMLFVAPRTYIPPVSRCLDPNRPYAVKLDKGDAVGTGVRYCLTKDDVIFLRPANLSFETAALNVGDVDYFPVSGLILAKVRRKEPSS